MAKTLEERLKRVRERTAELATRDEFSGVLHVQRGEETLLSSAHGIASRRWGIPVRASTRFDIASVTKVLTAIAVLQLVDAGPLGLDDRIHDYVELTDSAIHPNVTLRQLLSHTSGIGDDADEEAGESYEALWQERPNYSVTETQDFLPQFVHKPANFAPGEGCRYCNVGYILLGLAIENVTGERYRDVVRRAVMEKTGMRDSGFFDMRHAVKDVAEGWEPVRSSAEGPIEAWRQNIYSYPPIGSPDGGAHATAADLVRMLDAVLQGRILSTESTAMFRSPQALHHRVDNPEPGGTAELHYAFGLEIELDAHGRMRSLYKDGINTGASAIVRHYPAGDRPGITLAVVANSEDAAWEPVRLLDDAIIGFGSDRA
ncbi:MAG TPA: beta-lactamase family protein [Candidatus Agrococcus pullicola]|uniref:Beta-lactamase family protein n=1 Tax=Candidatus Agrococcus pullicola TaxID=2838429 RepID=A0A9D1YX24_9MICO|nr:beta-lactamase family protein [Candidatus Agrococcus pullicola]